MNLVIMFMYKHPELTMNISMCSINVCGLNSKLKYTILQDYMKQFDSICLTETKCDSIVDNEINGFKSFIMRKKNTNMGVFTEYAGL